MSDPFPKFGEAILEYKRDTIKSQIKAVEADIQTLKGFQNKPLVIQFYSISKIRVCNITDDELQQHLAQVSLDYYNRRLEQLQKELNTL